MSTNDLQTLAVDETSPAKEPYAGVNSPNSTIGSPPGPLALLVKVDAASIALHACVPDWCMPLSTHAFVTVLS